MSIDSLIVPENIEIFGLFKKHGEESIQVEAFSDRHKCSTHSLTVQYQGKEEAYKYCHQHHIYQYQ